jgi:sugar phosphate isomerase/epimerase
MNQLTRRTLLAAPAAALAAPPAVHPIRLGAPIQLKSDDPTALAHEHRRLGYAAAQAPNVKLGDKEKIAAIQKAYAAENVIIAEVGAWKNMLDPNAEERKKNCEFVLERMALAEALGARCCVDIAGSYNPKVWYGPHPKNLSQEHFDATVENCRRVIDTVKPRRSKFTVEMMGWATPEGPDSYLRLVKAVDRPAFAVHLDVCNGINSPQRFYNSAAFIEECFRKMGRFIVSVHAKDLAWPAEMNVHFVEVIPGRGEVDYRTWLRQMATLKDVPLMLEHLKGAGEYEEAANYIRRVGAEAGVSFV